MGIPVIGQATSAPNTMTFGLGYSGDVAGFGSFLKAAMPIVKSMANFFGNTNDKLPSVANKPVDTSANQQNLTPMEKLDKAIDHLTQARDKYAQQKQANETDSAKSGKNAIDQAIEKLAEILEAFAKKIESEMASKSNTSQQNNNTDITAFFQLMGKSTSVV
jgi:predicted RNA-binding protein Jag